MTTSLIDRDSCDVKTKLIKTKQVTMTMMSLSYCRNQILQEYFWFGSIWDINESIGNFWYRRFSFDINTFTHTVL